MRFMLENMCLFPGHGLVIPERKGRFCFLDTSNCDFFFFLEPVKEESKNKRAGILACRASAELMPVSSVVTCEVALP